MKRRLRVEPEIDADEQTCATCVQLIPGPRPRCALFDTGLMKGEAGPLRSTGCLAAEDAAKPWEADDDDPTPHHLRTGGEAA